MCAIGSATFDMCSIPFCAVLVAIFTESNSWEGVLCDFRFNVVHSELFDVQGGVA